MTDKIGMILARWRVRAVLPLVNGRLTDIGCGRNLLVRTYPGEGVGVDVYQWGDVDLVVEDSSRLPFDDASFDTVTIIAALNHIPNREQVLREAHRILKPGGRLVLTMLHPLVSRIWHFMRGKRDADQRERSKEPGELFGLAHKQIRKLAHAAGFRIISGKRFMLGFNAITVAEKPVL